MLSKIHSYCFFGDFVHWVMWILRTNVKMEMRLSQIQEVYRVVISKYIGEAYCRYQPYNEGVYPFFVCIRPGRLIAKVEHHTYFQHTVT